MRNRLRELRSPLSHLHDRRRYFARSVLPSIGCTIDFVAGQTGNLLSVLEFVIRSSDKAHGYRQIPCDDGASRVAALKGGCASANLSKLVARSARHSLTCDCPGLISLMAHGTSRLEALKSLRCLASLAEAEREFISTQRAFVCCDQEYISVERDFMSLQRDFISLQREFISLQRDFLSGQ